MSTFTDTLLQAVSDYRQLLKRHLKPAQRKAKLQELGLDVNFVSFDEIALYKLGQKIAVDLNNSFGLGVQGYYTYSGVQRFNEYLSAYLNEFDIEEDRLVHRKQQVSRALLHVIQLVSMSGHQLNLNAHEKLSHCGRVIAAYGSSEEHQRFKATLDRVKELDHHIHSHLVREFESFFGPKSSGYLLS